MANQDGLKQVGSGVGLEESMAQDETTVQDTAMQVDHPPQLDPEVVVEEAVQERPSVKFPPRSPEKP